MSIKGTIVTDLSARVLNNTSAKTFGRWNSQILNEDKLKQIDYNGVFVEFVAIPWEEQRRGVQKATAVLRFHFMFEELDADENAVTDEAMFEFVEEVHTFLQGFTLTNGGSLNRVAETDDIDHDRVSDWTVDYEVLITDTSACDLNNLESGLLTLKLNKQIGVTIITLPNVGNDTKILNFIFAEGGDNDIILDIDANGAGSYSSEALDNLDSVSYEIDTGGGFSPATLPFVLQIGDKIKVIADRTDDSLKAAAVVTGIS